MNLSNSDIENGCRYGLRCLEMAMSSSIGLSDSNTFLLIKAAGCIEVIFGLLIIVFYKHRTVIILNILGLIALLGFVVIQMPDLLIEGFNPVTTNLPLIALSFILLDNLKQTSRYQHGLK